MQARLWLHGSRRRYAAAHHEELRGQAMPRLRQHVLYLGYRTRRAEQIALRLRAALPAQEVELRVGLDAFSRGDDAEALAEAGHRADDRHRLLARCQFAHKRTVDLDLVERKTTQIAQRRVPRSEVVERYPDAKAAKLVQNRQRCLAVLQQHRFRYLQFEPMRREAGSLQRFLYRRDQIWILELHRRKIDRDADVPRPLRRIHAGLPQHPLADRHDQAGFFRQRNEIGWRDHAAQRMIPPRQGFETHDHVLGNVADRLVIDLEFIAPQRGTQVEFQQPPRLCAGVHPSLEETV